MYVSITKVEGILNKKAGRKQEKQEDRYFLRVVFEQSYRL